MSKRRKLGEQQGKVRTDVLPKESLLASGLEPATCLPVFSTSGRSLPHACSSSESFLSHALLHGCLSSVFSSELLGGS